MEKKSQVINFNEIKFMIEINDCFIDEHRTEELTLLSCSMDKTMIRWKLDSESGIWTEQVRTFIPIQNQEINL